MLNWRGSYRLYLLFLPILRCGAAIGLEPSMVPLAIEQNTLSLAQVTAVLNGQYVLSPPKDIAKVKHTYEIYERLDELDSYSVDDLLTAHGIMTRGLVEESDVFLTRPVDSEGCVLHYDAINTFNDAGEMLQTHSYIT